MLSGSTEPGRCQRRHHGLWIANMVPVITNKPRSHTPASRIKHRSQLRVCLLKVPGSQVGTRTAEKRNEENTHRTRRNRHTQAPRHSGTPRRENGKFQKCLLARFLGRRPVSLLGTGVGLPLTLHHCRSCVGVVSGPLPKRFKSESHLASNLCAHDTQHVTDTQSQQLH